MPITGSCHCGKTSFVIEGEIPAKLTRCTCSICAKRGALYAYYRPDQFRLTSSPENRAEYRWGVKTSTSYFCPHCGCATYNDSPDYQRDGTWDGTTRRYGVNARLFDHFTAADAPYIEIDGKNLW
jgi:hypothetical protein